MKAGTAARPRGPVTADHLRSLVRNSPLPVMLLHIESARVVEASDSLLSFLGRDRGSILGLAVTELSEQPEAATKSLSLVASGVIDGYTRHATFRRPSGEPVEGDLRITACTEEKRQHAVVSLLPPSWAAEDAATLEVAAENASLVMGTVSGQWVVDRITAGDHPELAFRSAELLHRSIFVAIHPEDVGELMFIAAQASRQRGGAFGRVRFRASGGGWTLRRLGLQPLDAAPSSGYAFALSGLTKDSASALEGGDARDVEAVVETTLSTIRASAVAGWMVTFPTALELPELSTLTAREYEILLRLASGERVRLIAQGLHLGESTVRNHLTSIFRKTGVRSQNELLAILRQHV